MCGMIGYIVGIFLVNSTCSKKNHGVSLLSLRGDIF